MNIYKIQYFIQTISNNLMMILNKTLTNCMYKGKKNNIKNGLMKIKIKSNHLMKKQKQKKNNRIKNWKKNLENLKK